MAASRGRSTSPQRPPRATHLEYTSEDDSILGSRQLEAFGRTVHATAAQLVAGSTFDAAASTEHYRNALTSVHRLAGRPLIQRSVFSFASRAAGNPRELLRGSFSAAESEHRARAYLPDELLRAAPARASPYSLFEGFKASLPSAAEEDAAGEGSGNGKGGKKTKKKHGRGGSSGRKLLEAVEEEEQQGPPKLVRLKRDRDRLEHRLEMMGVRKTMCASEIREIDEKIANLNTMRKVILDRLAGLEDEEREMEHELGVAMDKLEVMQEEIEDEAALASKSPAFGAVREEAAGEVASEIEAEAAAAAGETPPLMAESTFSATPRSGTKTRRKRVVRKVSTPVLHEHMDAGSLIREIPAHNDMITALDFDAPFGTMVTAALDDTVRVWDLNAGRCMGLLEGHLSSVRCLQVEGNLVATGSMDATIRLWDLNQADYTPPPVSSSITSRDDPDAPSSGEDLYSTPEDAESVAASPPVPSYRADAMADCHLYTLTSHVAEITALHLHGDTLVSGSADKTLRQWDLEKGRCVQTLDVLWAAAQASTINTNTTASPPSAFSPAFATANTTDGGGSWWRPTTGRIQSAEADFVGALQVFDAALACGTADGMVRLWDLRSGMVHRSLVGHTGPITALQFDDVFLVTGSRDRSIRIWDLRTGNIHDAFAYDAPITSLQFDARRIVAAAGENVVKVYDKTDGRQWDCGDVDGKSIIERVRIKDGYLCEGRKDGTAGVWSC